MLGENRIQANLGYYTYVASELRFFTWTELAEIWDTGVESAWENRGRVVTRSIGRLAQDQKIPGSSPRHTRSLYTSSPVQLDWLLSKADWCVGHRTGKMLAIRDEGLAWRTRGELGKDVWTFCQRLHSDVNLGIVCCFNSQLHKLMKRISAFIAVKFLHKSLGACGSIARWHQYCLWVHCGNAHARFPKQRWLSSIVLHSVSERKVLQLFQNLCT
jgi:hypothetical protein